MDQNTNSASGRVKNNQNIFKPNKFQLINSTKFLILSGSGLNIFSFEMELSVSFLA